SDLCQSIGLVHKLRELATTKKFSHSSDDRANINQRVGSGLPRLLNAHAFFDHALHAQQTHTELRLNQFADTAHATVAQVVDIVFAAMSGIQGHQPTHNIDQIVERQNALALWDRQIQFAVEFIATDAAHVV